MKPLDIEKIDFELLPPKVLTELIEKEEDELYPEARNRFVAFLDILGFKDMVDRNSPEVVHKRYLDVISNPPSYFYGEKCKIHTYIFSDSIVIYSDDDSADSASQIFEYSQLIIIRSVACGTLLKGAIAHGEFTADKKYNIYFGIPLIDAFQLEEEMKVSSIILHHTCEKFIDSFGDSQFDQFFVDSSTQLKSGKVRQRHLNWMKELKTVDDSFYQMFYNQASGPARIYIENTKELISSTNKKDVP
jgi:hypothetical protein